MDAHRGEPPPAASGGNLGEGEVILVHRRLNKQRMESYP